MESLDNFKFMDSWPAWVRGPLAVAVVNVIVLPVFLVLETRDYGGSLFFQLVCLLGSACAIWCGVATVPSAKLATALVLGGFVLSFAYTSYQWDIRAASIPSMLNLDPTHRVSLALVGGVVVGWGVVTLGYLRRRRASLPSRAPDA